VNAVLPLRSASMGLLALLALGLLLSLALLTAYTARVLTRPPRRGYTWALARGLAGTPMELPPATEADQAAPATGPRPFSTFTIRSRGRDLPAWDIPGDAPDGPAVIFVHGWGESRVHGLARLGAWLPHASRVLMLDLPAHGDAPGALTMGTAEVDDLLAALDAVPAEPAASPGGRPVVLHGFSLGAGLCIAAAARLGEGDARGARVMGVIAEAPYRFPQTPARRVMAAAGYPVWPAVPLALGLLGLLRFGQGWSWFLAEGAAAFDRAALARAVRVPLLVIHGERDEVCPPDDGRSIAEAAPMGQLVLVPSAGHLDLWTDPASREAAASAVRAFMDAARVTRA
jgi:pimeloyl-ACP methyl ester carboxylesterase